MVTLDKNKKILTDPVVSAYGFIDAQKSKKLVENITNKTLEVLNTVLAKYKIVNVIAIKSALVSGLSQYIYDEIEHRPFIVPIVNVM